MVEIDSSLKIVFLGLINLALGRPQQETEELRYDVVDDVQTEVSSSFYATGQFWIIVGILLAVGAGIGLAIWKKRQNSI